MPSFMEILLLAIVQGITEWLPVSSSGHLVIVQEAFGIQVPVAFDVLLHLATLTVVFVVFRARIVRILRALFNRDLVSPDGRMALFVVTGSVPTAILGYVFHHRIIPLFGNTTAVGAALLTSGFVLFISKTRRQRRSPNTLDSILMGTAQGVALVPGISRSGVTIATGLLRGVKRYEAAELSFLMSIPAILGATVVETVNLACAGINANIIVTGFAVAALVGYASLRILLAAVTRGRLRLFAYYCWAVGLVTILVSL